MTLKRRRDAAAAEARWRHERDRWMSMTARLRGRIADHRASIVTAAGFASGCVVGLVRWRGVTHAAGLVGSAFALALRTPPALQLITMALKSREPASDQARVASAGDSARVNTTSDRAREPFV
ncbi:MAG TPA: hypothetical protein VGC30_03815 [Dokdonella sp.]